MGQMADFRDEQAALVAIAKGAVERFAAQAQARGMPRGRITTAVLQPEGDSQGGPALCRFAKVRQAKPAGEACWGEMFF